MKDLNTTVDLKNWEEVSAYAAESAFLKATELLLEKMEQKGLSQRQLAMLAQKDPAEVSRVLSGTRNVTLKTMAELFAAIGELLMFETVSIDASASENPYQSCMQYDCWESVASFVAQSELEPSHDERKAA